MSNAKNAKKIPTHWLTPLSELQFLLDLTDRKTKQKKKKVFSSAHHNTARDKKELIFSLHLFLLLPNKTYLFDQLTEKKKFWKKKFWKNFFSNKYLQISSEWSNLKCFYHFDRMIFNVKQFVSDVCIISAEYKFFSSTFLTHT